MFSLEGKVTVITGGSSGIGRAAAERFRKAGAEVVVAGRRKDEGFATQIGASFIQADVEVENQVKDLMDETAARFGRIDVSINNAGVFEGPTSLEEMSQERMAKVISINAIGPFFGMKHAVRHMRRGGVIINTSSIAGVYGTPGFTDYTASKFALNGISRCAALEFGPLGIRVNCICPAAVGASHFGGIQNAAAELMCRTMSALETTIAPEEVAALMHFLAADDCPTITGQEIVLDGGILAGFSVASTAAIMTTASSS